MLLVFRLWYLIIANDIGYHYYWFDFPKPAIAPSPANHFLLRLNMKKNIFMAVALVSPLAFSAESPSQLDPLVVSATRVERQLSDAPVRMEVVSRYEIKNIHARSLKEALENIPGLQLREIHGKSGYEASLQGFTSDQLLIVIDGMPLAASTGSSVDLSQYAVLDIERIEVIKGAASAQYGSSAMGGVINIITRQAKSGLRGALMYDVGSYGEQNIGERRTSIAQHHASAVLEGGSDVLKGRVSADVRNNKGFDATPETWSRQGDDSQRKQYSAMLMYQPQAHSYLSVEGQRFEEDDKQWLPEENKRLPNKYEEISRNRFNVNAGHRFDNGTGMTFKALFERYQSESYKQNIGFVPYDLRDMRLETDFFSWQLDLPSGFLNLDQHLLQLGIEVRNEALTQLKDGAAEIGDAGKADRQNYEFFLQDDYFFSDDGELVLGVRLQEDSDFGFHASPKAALKYRLFEEMDQQLLVRASVGTGYRVPNLKERYYTFDHSSIGYMVMGNPNLEPEVSTSYQFGALWQMNDDSSFDINAFYNDIHDLIQTDEDRATVVNGISIYSYENIDSAETYGVETVFKTRLMSDFGITAAHTYTRTKNKSTGEVLTQKPEHIARLGLDWQVLDAWNITLRGRYQSRELAATSSKTWSPEWLTFDLKTSYQWTPYLRGFAGIDNLTNEQRDFASGTDFGPIAGRFVYVGMEVQFGH